MIESDCLLCWSGRSGEVRRRGGGGGEVGCEDGSAVLLGCFSFQLRPSRLIRPLISCVERLDAAVGFFENQSFFVGKLRLECRKARTDLALYDAVADKLRTPASLTFRRDGGRTIWWTRRRSSTKADLFCLRAEVPLLAESRAGERVLGHKGDLKVCLPPLLFPRC
jgi:hypothetical protein